MIINIICILENTDILSTNSPAIDDMKIDFYFHKSVNALI